MQDLKKKAKLREKFGVKDEWVLDLEVIPIIEIEGFGNKSAEKVRPTLRSTPMPVRVAALHNAALARCVPRMHAAVHPLPRCTYVHACTYF